MKKIIIIGNGKLSEAIKSGFPQYSNIPVQHYFDKISADEQSLFVHIGSGRQYPESLKNAISNHSIFIQAATEKNIKMSAPSVGSFKFINAPNLDINIVKLFYLLHLSDGLFCGENISITESHQKEKKSQPGTAFKICDYLNIPHEKVLSIRDEESQKKLGISHLNHHAFHQITIGNKNSNIKIETKIEGAESYVFGLSKIVHAAYQLSYGIYEVEDLLKLKLF